MKNKFLLKAVSVILLLGVLVGVVACERNNRKQEDIVGDYTLARVDFKYNDEEISYNVNEIDKIEDEKQRQLVQAIYDVYSKNKIEVSVKDGRIFMAAKQKTKDDKWVTSFQNFSTVRVPDIEGNAYQLDYQIAGALSDFFYAESGMKAQTYLSIYYRNGQYEFFSTTLDNSNSFKYLIKNAGVESVRGVFVRNEAQISG